MPISVCISELIINAVTEKLRTVTPRHFFQDNFPGRSVAALYAAYEKNNPIANEGANELIFVVNPAAAQVPRITKKTVHLLLGSKISENAGVIPSK